ncbi:MAG: sarcosine oxidase [Bradyrhizobiaceae bacterium]|nr:MAG: sarcosine oxidase [Bradyrhizobiaceae bacterium]
MAQSLLIADLSGLPRLGFKGRGTLAAMQARGLQLANTPNRAFRQADGSLCMVLAASEVFLLGSLTGDSGKFAEFETNWRIDDNERTYPMPRRHSHSWFALQGDAAPEFFSKLCAVDLRPHVFGDLAIAQTSVARLSAIVLRADSNGGALYHLLSDSASSDYMLACLKDAAGEFGGTIADSSALARHIAG